MPCLAWHGSPRYVLTGPQSRMQIPAIIHIDCGLLVPVKNIKPHTGFIRTPLNILNRLSVAYKCMRANLPNTFLSRFPYVYMAGAVSRGQSTRHCG